MKVRTITRRLVRALEPMRFGPPVTHVYNPLVYARAMNERYLERFARRGVDALLLGMNPGPWGMAQTGIPFGEVSYVRDWLQLDARIDKPADEHPKRPVTGLDCERSEVSGRRIWSWASARFDSPEAFFERFFVWNFCPLSFMEESGKNRTPDKLPPEERTPLFEVCDESLRQIVEELRPRQLIGIGKFAEARALAALGSSLPIGTVLHPSPASPLANRGWAPQAEKQLVAQGIALP